MPGSGVAEGKGVAVPALEHVRRWLTTVALVGLALAALVAVFRPPSAGADEPTALPIGSDATGLREALMSCLKLGTPLARLDCLDAGATAIDGESGWLEAEIRSCTDRLQPLDRLDCYSSVLDGKGVPSERNAPLEAEEPDWPEVNSGSPMLPPGDGPVDVECYTLPPLASFDTTVPMTIRDHLAAGRTSGAIVFGNGNVTYPYVICAW